MVRRNAMAVQQTMFGMPAERTSLAVVGDDVALTEFDGQPVRLVSIDGEPWWVLSDVAKVLGYRDSANAARVLRDKHKGTHQMSTPSGTQQMLVVSEPGLYRLMMRSERPNAERFQDWITDDVLPTIRKTGRYEAPSARQKRYAGKLKTNDASVLAARLNLANRHRDVNRKLADEGFKPNDYRRYHDTKYREWCGRSAAELRAELGLSPGASPLDRMSDLVLVHADHALALARRVAEMRAGERGAPLSPEEQSEVYAESVRDIRDADLRKLGATYAVVADPRRGHVLDVVQASIGPLSA
jgi:prophage antirepressor-like protein